MNATAIAARNEELAKALITGSKAARDEMITINMPLVATTVNRFLKAHPGYRQSKGDLIGVGMVTLVKAVDCLVGIADTSQSVRNYLITAIRSKLLNEMGRQHNYYKKHYHVPSYDSLPEALLAVEDENLERVVMSEVLHSVCETEIERTVLQMALGQATLAQLLEVTGLSKPVLYRMLRKLRKKAQNKWRE